MRDIHRLTPAIMSVTTVMMMVASALMSGLTPRRTFEKITIGSVLRRAGDEARDHQVVERQREGQQPARDQRRRDDRQGDDEEDLRAGARPDPSPLPRARSKVDRRDWTTTVT